MHLAQLFTLTALVLSVALVVQAQSGQVRINSAQDYCLILPSKRNTVGASEDGGDGAKSFCTQARGGQGSIPNIFTHGGPHVKTTSSYKQITGCINPSKASTLIASDGGGQYDSNGGAGGRGNPPGSTCEGYASYVELVEPAGNRACLRCCKKASDCDLSQDTSGCQTVIKNGNYDGCSN